MANTARLAFWRSDLISRLIALVVCVYVAITPTLIFANSYTGAVDFNGFNNFSRNAGGAVADFWFKNKNTAQVFASKAQVISNSVLGAIAFKRILRLTGYVGAAYAVYEIVTELQKEGWTVDTANQEIYKLEGGLTYAVGQNGFQHKRLSSPSAAIDDFIQKSFNGEASFEGFTNDWSIPLNILSAGANSSRHFKINSGGQTFSYPLDAHKSAASKVLATDADVTAVLPKVSDSQIEALVATPDYAKEPHPPTLAAAARAAAATPTAGRCAGLSGTFNGAVHCISDAPAGIQENLSGETGSGAGTAESATSGVGSTTNTNTSTTTNADGSVTTTTTETTTNADGTTTTKTTSTTTNPDGTTTTTSTSDASDKPPPFCTYAQAVCDWIGWTKEEPVAANPAQTKVDIKDRDTGDIPGLPTAIDTSRIQWAQICPAPISANFSLMGQSVGMSYKFDVVCDFAAKFRPYVIGLSYLTGAYIVMGLNRTRSE